MELAPDEAVRSAVNRAAGAHGVPAGLIAALTVEAVRSLERAAALARVRPDRLVSVLNGETDRPIPPVLVPEARRLAAYTRALRAGCSPTVLPRGSLRIPVPAPAAAAWALAAAGTARTADWALAQLRAGEPACALRWETAAAGSGALLGEWIYAAALRAVATASPQSRR